MASKKLPRHPHADRPRPDETVRRHGHADLQNGWYARHGRLSLCDARIVFAPTPLDTLMRAKRREILLERIESVERLPRDPDGTNPGGRRARMVITDHECAYQFMVSDLDSWIDMIEIVTNRQRTTAGVGPILVLRENYENPVTAALNV